MTGAMHWSAARLLSIAFLFPVLGATAAACSSTSTASVLPDTGDDAGSSDPSESTGSDASTAPPDARSSGDAAPSVTSGDDAATSSGGNTALGTCASKFGTALTNAYGRIDGTLIAIVPPKDQTCALPNSTHITIQVQMNGEVYRMVTNVQSDSGPDFRVRFATLDAALPAPAWSEGWHTGVALDYVSLGAHSTDPMFVPIDMDPLVTKVISELEINAPISVYATSGSDNSGSAHLVHRESGKTDGAIVVEPTGPTPKFLLFHFLEQTF